MRALPIGRTEAGRRARWTAEKICWRVERLRNRSRVAGFFHYVPDVLQSRKSVAHDAPAREKGQCKTVSADSNRKLYQLTSSAKDVL